MHRLREHRLVTQGGQNPGTQPDLLVRLQQGKYYGHPNPYRNECVFKDGSYQGVAAPANYVAPILSLGNHKSSNGVIEYTASTFGGALRGELLIVNYSSGDDITRVKLSADGASVVSSGQLLGGLSDPLALAQDPDGTLYVAEFGAGRVAILVPTGGTTPPPSGGTWSSKTAMPAAVLDAGGVALDGKLYSVAGKTSTGYLRTVYVYDPVTNAWSTAPSLPNEFPAVENPAAAVHDGKLYVFGGSTSAFSGATTSAAVFDPATSAWTMLPAMPVARGGATAQSFGGKLFVVGGMDATGESLATVSVFDPLTSTWAAGPTLQTARDNPGSAVLGDKLFVFGGRTRLASGTEVNGTLATVERLDTPTSAWATAAPMPTGRRTMVVGVAGGKAQVMGGERTTSGGTFPANEQYDPVTNTWTQLTPMTTGRHGAAAGTIAGVVYVPQAEGRRAGRRTRPSTRPSRPDRHGGRLPGGRPSARRDRPSSLSA